MQKQKYVEKYIAHELLKKIKILILSGKKLGFMFYAELSSHNGHLWKTNTNTSIY